MAPTVRAMLARRAAESRGELASALLGCLDQLGPTGPGEARAALEVAARLICFAAGPGDREEPVRRDPGAALGASGASPASR